MKRIFLFTFFIFAIYTGFSQYCVVGNPEANNLKSAYSYTPNSQMKYLRIIIHYILKDDGSGNFNETDDGMSPSHDMSGYAFADYILNYANVLLQYNNAMRLQPFGNVPVYDPGYRYRLCGVFFWRNTSLYDTYDALENLDYLYGQCTQDAINIFIQSAHGSTGGYVRDIGDHSILLFFPYTRYILSKNNNDNWYNEASATLINHEVGHSLDLYHTLMTNGGTCYNDWNDFCDDTPNINQMLNLGSPNPCCWCDTICSNNVMDYNCDQKSITPDQLDRIHESLDNSKYNYRDCNYSTSNQNISTFGSNSGAFISQTFSISSSTALITNGQTIYLTCNEVTFNSGFEVEIGGKLIVNSCDE